MIHPKILELFEESLEEAYNKGFADGKKKNAKSTNCVNCGKPKSEHLFFAEGKIIKEGYYCDNQARFKSVIENAKDTLDAPCVVCQQKEEVDSGMCEDCRDEAINYLNQSKDELCKCGHSIESYSGAGCHACGVIVCGKFVPQEIFVDFRGKRFYPPFKCLCCGKEVDVQQFCYGRTCGYCDCGKCQTKEHGYENGHNRRDIFEQAEDVPQDKHEHKFQGDKCFCGYDAKKHSEAYP